MAYAPPIERVQLRSRDRLERAMRNRDVNASELATLAGTTRQSISRLRRGERDRMDRRVARNIERALRVEPGDLFTEDTDA